MDYTKSEKVFVKQRNKLHSKYNLNCQRERCKGIETVPKGQTMGHGNSSSSNSRSSIKLKLTRQSVNELFGGHVVMCPGERTNETKRNGTKGTATSQKANRRRRRKSRRRRRRKARQGLRAMPRQLEPDCCNRHRCTNEFH